MNVNIVRPASSDEEHQGGHWEVRSYIGRDLDLVESRIAVNKRSASMMLRSMADEMAQRTDSCGMWRVKVVYVVTFETVYEQDGTV
jgi:hypothetical protein